MIKIIVGLLCILSFAFALTKEEEYEKAARYGDIEANFNLGNINYKRGVFFLRDSNEYRNAFAYYSYAATRGHIEAQIKVAEMYYGGYGVQKDYQNAVVWYEKAAAQGSKDAQVEVADMYYSGKGIEKDYKKAFMWLEKAAAQGHVKSIYKVGYMYENGLGVKQDYKKAFTWYEILAINGYSDIQYIIGDMYYTGKGIEQDYKKAFDWFEKGATKGDVDAQRKLAVMYKDGIGIKKDIEKAKKMLSKLADEGDIDSRRILGKIYSYGNDKSKTIGGLDENLFISLAKKQLNRSSSNPFYNYVDLYIAKNKTNPKGGKYIIYDHEIASMSDFRLVENKFYEMNYEIACKKNSIFFGDNLKNTIVFLYTYGKSTILRHEFNPSDCK